MLFFKMFRHFVIPCIDCPKVLILEIYFVALLFQYIPVSVKGLTEQASSAASSNSSERCLCAETSLFCCLLEGNGNTSDVLPATYEYYSGELEAPSNYSSKLPFFIPPYVDIEKPKNSSGSNKSGHIHVSGTVVSSSNIGAGNWTSSYVSISNLNGTAVPTNTSEQSGRYSLQRIIYRFAFDVRLRVNALAWLLFNASTSPSSTNSQGSPTFDDDDDEPESVNNSTADIAQTSDGTTTAHQRPLTGNHTFPPGLTRSTTVRDGNTGTAVRSTSLIRNNASTSHPVLSVTTASLAVRLVSSTMATTATTVDTPFSSSTSPTASANSSQHPGVTVTPAIRTSLAHVLASNKTNEPVELRVTAAPVIRTSIAHVLAPNKTNRIGEDPIVPKSLPVQPSFRGCSEGTCPKGRGQFASPDGCQYFLNCWDSCGWTQRCPGNLVFDESRQWCEWPWRLSVDHPCHTAYLQWQPRPPSTTTSASQTVKHRTEADQKPLRPDLAAAAGINNQTMVLAANESRPANGTTDSNQAADDEITEIV